MSDDQTGPAGASMSDELRAAVNRMLRHCQPCLGTGLTHRDPNDPTCWLCGPVRHALTTAPAGGATGEGVWVLQKIEDSGVELAGVYRDLEQAKRALEGRYPNLSAWRSCERCGDPDCGRWVAHTGKHEVLIEPAWLDGSAPADAREAERERVINAARSLMAAYDGRSAARYDADPIREAEWEMAVVYGKVELERALKALDADAAPSRPSPRP